MSDVSVFKKRTYMNVKINCKTYLLSAIRHKKDLSVLFAMTDTHPKHTHKNTPLSDSVRS